MKDRLIEPVVSTDWLAANLIQPDLVIIDIRAANEYKLGHIPAAINVPWEFPICRWIIQKGDLLLEVPEQADLFKTIGSCGITPESLAVIVNKVADPSRPPSFPRAEATRVADTLIYAGVKNVAVLDGGHDRWASEGKTLSCEITLPEPLTYRGNPKKNMFVTREYVQAHIGIYTLIDARDPDVYFGITVEPYANKAGHIPGAISLPAPWIWKADGTFKGQSALKEMISGIVPKNKNQGLIVYCGVGGYASAWWFVLTQILGYKNTRFYDGSAQEWVQYYDTHKYIWE